MTQRISDTGRKKNWRFLVGKIWDRFSRLRKRLWNRIKKKETVDTQAWDEAEQEESWENPYLDDFRNILLQILKIRHMEFGEFHPILIDSDEREQSFLVQEDTVRLLAQIGEGLNTLEILTDRPEYFRSFSERMNEEYGLLIQIYPRDFCGGLLGNVVLDLERHSELDLKRWTDKILYIPFYKRRWRESKDRKSAVKQRADEMSEVNACIDIDDIDQRNLDIEVPIGYNIVTVKTKASDIQNRL